MVQLAGGDACEIWLSVAIELPPLVVQLPTPAGCVSGQTQYFRAWLTVNLRGSRTAPLGELGVPVPMTSSALTRSGATGSPAASDVPMPCAVRAFEDTSGQRAFEESVHAPPSYIPCHIS